LNLAVCARLELIPWHTHTPAHKLLRQDLDTCIHCLELTVICKTTKSCDRLSPQIDPVCIVLKTEAASTQLDVHRPCSPSALHLSIRCNPSFSKASVSRFSADIYRSQHADAIARRSSSGASKCNTNGDMVPKDSNGFRQPLILRFRFTTSRFWIAAANL
jgi:hypothetical protein